MKLLLELNDKSADIHDLNTLIQEQNLKGVQTNVVEGQPIEGSMGAADFLPIIQMVLGSTVAAAGVKGLFDVLKNYFDLKKQRLVSDENLEKAKIEEHKIEMVVETAEGKKVNVKFSSFNEAERKTFLSAIDKALQ
jgi:hypothetical protein